MFLFILLLLIAFILTGLEIGSYVPITPETSWIVKVIVIALTIILMIGVIVFGINSKDFPI